MTPPARRPPVALVAHSPQHLKNKNCARVVRMIDFSHYRFEDSVKYFAVSSDTVTFNLVCGSENEIAMNPFCSAISETTRVTFVVS